MNRPRQRLVLIGATVQTLRGLLCWAPDRLPLTLQASGEGVVIRAMV